MHLLAEEIPPPRGIMKHFGKYEKHGAYHWGMISRDLRHHHLFTAARYELCLRMMGDIRGRKVLDFGCGDGALTGLLYKRGAQVTGVDTNELGISLARQKFVEHQFKGEFITDSSALPDNTFDLCVCCEVIEHVDQPDLLLVEIARVLKPSGIAIISTPIRFTESPLDHEHVKEFFPSEFRQLCETRFRVLELRQEIPLYKTEMFLNRSGLWGKIQKGLLNFRSAWLHDNYLLRSTRTQRYFSHQIAKVQKSL